MQVRKNTTQTPDPQVPTEIFDLLVGFEEKEKIQRKQRASKRMLEARRAIERRQEEKDLARSIEEELWFEDI